MKTISIITVLFFFLSQAGFADTTDQSNGCCQTSQESAIQYQQLMQDQIQHETEEMRLHHAVTSSPNMQAMVTTKLEEASCLSRIQDETENVSMESLHQLSQNVQQHVSNNVSTAVK